MKTMNETFTLYNGVKIPKLGFGTWQISNGPVCYDSVTSALKSGYRHIDTASAYGNEESVERQSEIPNRPEGNLYHNQSSCRNQILPKAKEIINRSPRVVKLRIY